MAATSVLDSLSNGGSSSSVKRYGDGQVIDGVTISVKGSGANNAGASAFWPGTDMDPYYVKAADDLVYSTDSGLGITGRSNELNITTTGLEADRLYTVRIYSLVNEDAAAIDVAVTDGESTVIRLTSTAKRCLTPIHSAVI